MLELLMVGTFSNACHSQAVRFVNIIMLTA